METRATIFASWYKGTLEMTRTFRKMNQEITESTVLSIIDKIPRKMLSLNFICKSYKK